MSATQQDPTALFKAEQLDAAIEAANQAVRRSPAHAPARVRLAELLVFAGNLERADAVLDTAVALDPAIALSVAEFRQLLRAEIARHQVWQDGRVPEFLGQPGDMEQALLAAICAARLGENDRAISCSATAERVRPPSPMYIDGKNCNDFRDADDLCAGIVEVLTTTGKYFWIPIARIGSIDFHLPRRPRDLAWRRASMSVTDGPEGEVYVPVIYAGTCADASNALRLGRETAWSNGAPVRGFGQRTFLAGESGPGIMEISELRFSA
jgi:type VI secretion system protein ImpE